MNKQPIIDSLVERIRAAGYTPDSVSGPDDCDVVVRFRDTKPPHTQTGVWIKAEEVAALRGKISGEPIDPNGTKLEELIANHLRHSLRLLENGRPAELKALAERAALGR